MNHRSYDYVFVIGFIFILAYNMSISSFFVIPISIGNDCVPNRSHRTARRLNLDYSFGFVEIATSALFL